MQAFPFDGRRLNARQQGLALIALFSTCLVVCDGSLATTTSTTINQAAQSRATSAAEQAAGQGRFEEAATQYEYIATQAGGAARDHALLKAARNYQLAGIDPKVSALLSQTSNTLNTNDTALRIVINAANAVRTNQAGQALVQLDQIPLPLPDDLAADILQVRTQAQFAAGRTVLAVNTATERERVLKSDTELSQNRQLIWNGLKQSAAAGRDLTPPSGVTRITAGWLELAKLMFNGNRDPFAFNRDLNDWRSRYAGHPGSSFMPVITTLPTPRSNMIALLLPLSGRQQAAGQAVRDGFLTALLQGGVARPSVQMFDTNELTAVGAYQRAIQAGADMIVGPLLKEDVDAIAQSNQVGVATLSLNLSDATQPPGLLFQFALDPESEARQAARRARADGFSKAIVLTPNNEWGLRMQKAFNAELQAQQGSLVEARSYDPNAKDYVNFIKTVFGSKKPQQTKALEQSLGRRQVAETRDDYDFVFIAAQNAQAKQLRPALRFVLPDVSAPIYTTSDSFDAESSTNSDLNDTRLADMPWAINRDGEASLLHDTLSRMWSNNMRSRSRLYAFGIDAFRISQWLRGNQASLGTTLRGVTGLLALDSTGHIQRQLDWAQIVNGKPQPINSTTP